jgi:hypothetical protein
VPSRGPYDDKYANVSTGVLHNTFHSMTFSTRGHENKHEKEERLQTEQGGRVCDL